jgi:3-deoxy-D-manno-octulosonic-acid transferase
MIEPAAWGVPILTGPYLFNFSEASQLLIGGGAMQVCDNSDLLAEQVVELLQNQQRCAEMGSAAQRIADANRGALDKLLSVIEKTI